MYLSSQLTKLSEELIIPPANDIFPLKLVLEGVERRNLLQGSHSCIFSKFGKDLINAELVQFEVQSIDLFGELDGFCIISQLLIHRTVARQAPPLVIQT